MVASKLKPEPFHEQAVAPKKPFTMLQRLSPEDLAALPKVPRLNLFNALSGPQSVNLIGTQDAQGNPNLAVFNSITHIGSHPPLLGFMLRPLTEPRHTYQNLKATGFFTINQVHAAIYPQAHQTSAKYPAGSSEFAAVGLTPWSSPTVAAPYVAESQIRLGLSFLEEHLIRANETLIIIGKVEEIWLPADGITASGHLNWEKYPGVAVIGLDGYCEISPLATLPYARP